MKIYVAGSLRNPKIPEFANFLERHGFEAFADWFACGPEADDKWQEYAKERGWSYEEALKSEAARHVFEFDKSHLDASDALVMLAPAGKSAHFELGYFIYNNKRPGYILYEQEPERYEVMVQFATQIFFDRNKLVDELRRLIQQPAVRPDDAPGLRLNDNGFWEPI